MFIPRGFDTQVRGGLSRCTGPTLNSCMRRRDSLPSCVSRSRASAFSLRVPCLCMCACLRLRAPLLPACVPCAYVSWCVCACVPGESVAGQCVPPDPGHAGGGDADDRQPLRLCLPPLLVSAHLQRLQGPPARGTPPPTLSRRAEDRALDIFPFSLSLLSVCS